MAFDTIKLETQSANQDALIDNDSLSAGYNILGTAWDNASDLYMYASGDLRFTPAVAPTAGTVFKLYFLYAADGTNYEDGSAGDAAAPGANPVWTFPARAVTTAHRISFGNIPLRPQKMTPLVRNELGQDVTALYLLIYGHNKKVGT